MSEQFSIPIDERLSMSHAGRECAIDGKAVSAGTVFRWYRDGVTGVRL